MFFAAWSFHIKCCAIGSQGGDTLVCGELYSVMCAMLSRKGVLWYTKGSYCYLCHWEPVRVCPDM